MSSFEVWLPLGAIGLYLFDSTLWLYSNELIFQHRGGRWICAGIPAFLVAGRRVYFPNPLTPGTPQFRVRWSVSDQRTEQETTAGLDEFLHALLPLKYLVNTLLVILLILPVELFLFGTGTELLVLMAAFYLLIVVTLLCIFRRRRQLRLTGRAFAALCFDSLACSPFAVNLVRKLSLRRSLAGNPVAFAARSFEPAALVRLVAGMSGRVREEQVREAGQTARWQELETYRQHLEAMVADQLSQGRG
jgi:hypothetical protein